MGGYSTESVGGRGRHYKAFFFMNPRQNKEFWAIFLPILEGFEENFAFWAGGSFFSQE